MERTPNPEKGVFETRQLPEEIGGVCGSAN